MNESKSARTILDHQSTAVLLLDAALRFTYLNPAAEMLLAVSARQAAGLPASAVFHEGEALFAGLLRALEDGQSYTERALILSRYDGENITVDCTVTPYQDPGQPDHVLVELVQVDHLLRISREENLLAQQEATRALLRGLAHEVKNPLGGLRGAAQLLERELPTAELKEYTGIIIAEADRLQNLVDRMLGPHRQLARQRTNLHEVIERVRGLVQAEAPEGVHIERDYDPSIPDPFLDRDQIVQALLNIARNAVQAVGTSGSIRLETRAMRQVTIGQRQYRLVARVRVIDDGPGIPDEVRGRLFFPLVTSRAEGTGLGLSIAQSIVNRHGGLIEYTSEPGRTVFSILLPMEEAHEPA